MLHALSRNERRTEKKSLDKKNIFWNFKDANFMRDYDYDYYIHKTKHIYLMYMRGNQVRVWERKWTHLALARIRTYVALSALDQFMHYFIRVLGTCVVYIYSCRAYFASTNVRSLCMHAS